jgi:hypothetical protein
VAQNRSKHEVHDVGALAYLFGMRWLEEMPKVMFCS